jgi:protease YdgD
VSAAVVEGDQELGQMLEAVAQRLAQVQLPGMHPAPAHQRVASAAGKQAVQEHTGVAPGAGGKAALRLQERAATAVGSKSDLDEEAQAEDGGAHTVHDHHHQQQQQQQQEMGDSVADAAAAAAAGWQPGDSQLRRSLHAIIGSDDRRPCPNSWPFTVVGQLDVTDSFQGEICTGALIGPDKVLTAAHCVWNFRDNTFVNKVAFAPGRYQDGCQVVSPHGVIAWKHVTIFEVFSDEYVPDVAVITLEVPIGLKLGWLGLRSVCAGGAGGANHTAAAGASSSSKGKAPVQLTTAGYPRNRQQSKCVTGSCRVAFPDCTSYTVEHTCDTEPGQSGSPMWDSGDHIRVVHTSSDMFSVGPQLTNMGAQLSQFIFDNIVKW